MLGWPHSRPPGRYSTALRLLEFLGHVLQKLPDGQVLGADLLTFSAFHAVRGKTLVSLTRQTFCAFPRL